jgi:hypothetical protein
VGGHFIYTKKQLSVGVSSITFLNSIPWRAEGTYGLRGKTWSNHGIHYNYTWRNLHLFGELAVDKGMNGAVISGMMISVDPTVDLAILHRWIGKGYQAVNAGAFTEASKPSNEHGCYINVQVRPVSRIQVEGYFDLFIHPWLRFGVDRPSTGSDLSIMVTYTTRKNWRIHWQHVITRSISIRGRIEMVWYRDKDLGFLGFFDILYASSEKPWSVSLRYQVFGSDSYDSRIYAFENDVLNFYSIPAFFNKGRHYYINIKYRVSSKISFWMKWSSTLFTETTSIGSGLDKIAGNVRSVARGLFRINF